MNRSSGSSARLALRDGRIEEAVGLWKASTGKDYAARLRWLYEQNPAGHARIYVAADADDDRAVGALVVLPMRWRWDGEDLEVGQAIDGLVHPDFRGQGVFPRLIGHVFEDLRPRLPFLVGFPNEVALRSELKVGWEVLGHLDSYSLPLTGWSVARRLAAWKPVQRVLSAVLGPAVNLKFARVGAAGVPDALRRLDAASSPFDLGDASVTAAARARGVRDDAFLRWRLLGAPTPGYECFALGEGDDDRAGYFALRRKEEELEIVDLDLRPGRELEVLGALVAHGARSGAEAIHAQVSAGSGLEPWLLAAGFLRRKVQQPVIGYPLLRTPQEVPFSSWSLTQADTDWL